MRSKPHPAALERLADEELMTLVDRKDPDAFEVFYDRHGGAAYSLAHRIVGDPGMAEDVTQEAFLSIWRSKARFDAARGSVRAWALGIVRNRAIDALRALGASGSEARLATTSPCSRASPPASGPRPRRSGARPPVASVGRWGCCRASSRR